jgi:hypothetical protein
MKLKYLLTAAAATAVLGGAAYAQVGSSMPSTSAPPQSAPANPDPNAAPSSNMPSSSMPSGPVNAPAGTSSTTTTTTSPPGTAASSATAYGTGASVTVQTVTNGPVPDTPENRAKYPPLSRAGRHSPAKGN